MQTKTTNPPGYTYYYYVCARRNEVGPMGSCRQRVLRAEEAEADVWEFVSGALKDPERLRIGYERMIEDERKDRRGDPEQEAQLWAEKLAECARLRAAYQDQQAAGLMTLEELA